MSRVVAVPPRVGCGPPSAGRDRPTPRRRGVTRAPAGVPARALMVQGTASHVGKTVLVAALCRLFRELGWAVAPFKAQNMALNAYVTREGGEMGWAQALQAEAAGLEPTVDMNPILLKPQSGGSQVVVHGRVWATLSATAYCARRRELWAAVEAAYRRLARGYDLIVIEGAGCPAEPNLRAVDLANMAVARLARAPVLLVGDIDRGGVFASLVGTLALLPAVDRRRVRGFVLNKFRGDPALLAPGLADLEARTGRRVFGVIPYLGDLHLPEEDSVALEEPGPPAPRAREPGAGTPPAREMAGAGAASAPGPARAPARGALRAPQGRDVPGGDPGLVGAGALARRAPGGPAVLRTSRGGDGGEVDPSEPALLDIAVVRLPHIANFTDFAPLAADPAVRLRYVTRPEALAGADLVLLPGSKDTLADLRWLHAGGFAAALRAHVARGGRLGGICGGYQMLGEVVDDPRHLEGGGCAAGLALLPVATVLEPDKVTRRVRARLAAGGADFDAYEIHLGRTLGAPAPFAWVEDGRVARPDGAVSADGRVWGTYLHGLFDAPAVRRALLGRAGPVGAFRAERERTYARLAALLRAHLDLEALFGLVGSPPS